MAGPTLSFPVRANLEGLKKDMSEASSHVGAVTRVILKQFIDLNAQIAGPVAASLVAGYARAALGIAGKLALVVGSIKLMGDAIDAVKSDLKDMVDLADKATRAQVSPEFFQSFISNAKGATERVELFEGALDSAFQATKPLLNPDWSVWDQGLTKVSAVEKAMRDTRELFTTDQDFSGFELFRNAADQQAKIKAVLLYMQQLKAIGQDVAALDIGEKFFGAKFIDQVRIGKESIESISDTIERGSKENFLSDDAVKNAKALDDRLNDAWRTISERMKPDWQDLANIALRIKGVWTDVIEAIANYKAAAATARPFQGANSTSDADARNNPDPNEPAFANPRILNQGRRRRGQASDIVAGSSGDESAGLRMDRWQPAPASSEPIPLPQRRPLDAPKPETGIAQRDRFDATADSIEKRAAALEAETKTIDLNNEARERAKVAAELETVAKQANALAGLGENVVTREQKLRIDEVVKAYGDAAAAIAKARVDSSIAFGQGTAFLTPEDVQIAQQLKALYGSDIPAALNSSEAAAMRLSNTTRDIGQAISSNLTTALADVVDGTKTAAQAFEDFGKVVLRQIEEAIIKLLIVGPLMRGLQGGFGGLFGFADGGAVKVPGFATGGMITGPGTGRSDSMLARVSNGEYIVNAKATRENFGLLEAMNNNRLPRFADGGLVMPGAVSMPSIQPSRQAPSLNVRVENNLSFSTGVTPTDMAAITSIVQTATAQSEQRTVHGIREGIRRDSRFLG